MASTQRIARWGWIVALVAAAVVVTVVVGPGRSAGARAAAPAVSSDIVTVSGTGTVQAVPDEVTTTFGVHVSRGGVQEALDAVAASVNRVLTALGKAGVPSRLVRTTGLSIDRHYDRHGTPTGYDASETIEATLTPLKSAGRMISAAASASGNDVSVGGFSFAVDDDSPLLVQARAKAFDDAKARAQQYAELSHRSLGGVEKISETVAADQPRFYGGDALSAASFAAPVPIRGGQQPVAVTVTVVWQLR
jgi:uncharacterized protein YggE